MFSDSLRSHKNLNGLEEWAKTSMIKLIGINLESLFLLKELAETRKRRTCLIVYKRKKIQEC